VNSTLPEDLRITGMLKLTQDDAVFSGYGLAQLPGHAEAWGWDGSDLFWDAQLATSGAPLYVLRFRDDLDLGFFEARPDERGFRPSEHQNARVWSHDLDVGADWFGSTDLAVRDTALLPDGHTVLMAGAPEAPRAALDAAAMPQGSVEVDDLSRMALSLERPTSAIIEIDPTACAAYAEATAEVDTELVAQLGPLSAWMAMGIATYAEAGAMPSARLAFLASDDETAAAEVQPRERLAREGHSWQSAEAYADSAFTVDGAAASRDVIRLELPCGWPHTNADAIALRSRLATGSLRPHLRLR
jgi:hypothetical protein